MFRLHRHRSEISREKIDFKFSHFQALQVPKGWDRIFVSVVSVETGKTVAKSGKAAVRNGNCQWTETLSESIWVAQDDSSKEPGECLFKFVIATGSVRSGILGEAAVNLNDYMSSRALVPLSLPLKKCNHGTILQVKIQCLSPKTKLRDEKHSKDTALHQEDMNMVSDDTDNKSDGSDNVFNKSVGSSSSNHLGSAAHPGEFASRDTSFSASGSYHSSDSGEVSLGRMASPVNNANGDAYNLIGRQDSAGSQNIGVGLVDDLARSNPSSFNSRVTKSSSHLQNQWPEIAGQGSSPALAPLSFKTSDSSKDLLAAAEDTIEELRGEAKMWERNAKKLKIDLEILRKEFSDQSRRQADLDMELSAARTERDSFKVEIEQLKSFLDVSMLKQKDNDTLKARADDIDQMRKELEDEIKFQKESNANLTLQLSKTQESNIELVSVLQELEETIEKQKLEIEKLSAKKAEFSDTANIMHGNGNVGQLTDETSAISARVNMIDLDKCEEMLHPSSRDQLKELQVSQSKMQSIVKPLENSIEEKNHEIEQERALRNQVVLDIKAEWASKLSEKEEQIHLLEMKLSDLVDAPSSQNVGFSNGSDPDLMKEVEILRAKVQELERDCDELTDENLELIFKMKESKKDGMTGESPLIGELKSRIHQLEQQLKEMGMLGGATESFNTKTVDLQKKCTSLELELESFKEKYFNLDVELSKNQLHLEKKELELAAVQQQVESYRNKEIQWGNQIGVMPDQRNLEASMLFNKDEIESLRHLHGELETEVCTLQKEKSRLEETLEAALRESSITSKCMDDVRQDLAVVTNNMDSLVTANKVLERKLVELESSKHELELHISELEQENVQLSERLSGLDAQSRHLIDERESGRLELQHSKSLVVDLQNEIQRLGMQNVALKQKLQDTLKQSAQVEEELVFSKKTSTKLQATIESLIEECSSLQKLNDELRKQRLKLQEQCTRLETELTESRKEFSDCSKAVEVLEEKISSLHSKAISKEKSLTAELESILSEHRQNEEKLRLTQSLLEQAQVEKTVAIENLKRERANLTTQIMSTHDERERMASEAVLEVSSLRSEKTKLEGCLQDFHVKVDALETDLCTLRIESENKAQDLSNMLAASRRNEEMLMDENEQMKRLVEDVKTGAEKIKIKANEMELELKASEHEKEVSAEEIAKLKVQVQNSVNLQEEILSLKNSLDESKYGRDKLDMSLQLLSREFEDMKAERESFIEKISGLKTALSEAEEGKRTRVVLEEKLLPLENDLSAKEALCAQDAELKNELNRIKRTNSQLQRKIKCLEEERDEFLRRSQAFEEKLKLRKEDEKLDDKQAPSDTWNKTSPDCSECNGKVDLYQPPQILENNMERNGNQPHGQGNLLSMKTNQLQECPKGQQNFDIKHYQREDNNEIPDRKGRPQAGFEDDIVAKIKSLETELAEALEANNMYKLQLKSYLSDSQNFCGNDFKKSVTKNGFGKEEYEKKALSLETELKDMRERYFHMSLRYAEVEAEREELVMKVKSLRNGKRWFS